MKAGRAFAIRRPLAVLLTVAACGCDYSIPLIVWHEEGKHTIVPPALSMKLRSEDGSCVEWYTPLYHRTRAPGGETVSLHAGPYARGPGYRLLFPFYFEGRDYKFTPFGPVGRWEHPDGSSSVLATPFYYHRRDPEGQVATRTVFPFYARQGEHSNIPLLLTGWWRKEGRVAAWYSIPLLSGGRARPDGSSSTCLTPLVHWDRDASGRVRNWHALTAYGFEGVHHGVFPFWAGGPGYSLLPPLLSGRWARADGSSSTWLTPFVHWDRDPEGRYTGRHFLTAYCYEGSGGKHYGFFPFWAKGPRYVALPFIFLGRWLGSGKARCAWVTPLYHHTYDPSGKLTSRHVGPVSWTRTPAGWTLFPFAWSRLSRAGYRTTTVTVPPYERQVDPQGRLVYEVLFPLYARTPEHWFALPLLSGAATLPGGTRVGVSVPLLSARVARPDGTVSYWVTPLCHQTRDGKGRLLSWSVGPYARGRNYTILFPLFWHARGERGGHSGVMPFFARGPGYGFIPPILSGWMTAADGTRVRYCSPLLSWHSARPDGSSAAWVLFPLGHWTRDRKGNLTRSQFLPFYTWSPEHWSVPALLTYSRATSDGGREKMVLGPLYYKRTWADRSSSVWALWPLYHHERDGSGKVVRRHVLPFYMRGEGYRLFPFFLSGRWTSYDRSEHVWITPLYHHERDPSGKVVRRHVLPFYARGKNYRFIPLALSGRWTSYDGSRHTWVTPAWHWTRSKEGKLLHWHLLTFGGWEDGWSALPFAYGWRDGWTAPLLLSGDWTDFRGWRQTWYGPFYHRTVDRDGKLRHEHCLIYARWGERWWVFPFYGQGPDYRVCPLLLSASWSLRGGGRFQMCFPLFFRRVYSDGGETGVTPLLYWKRPAPGLPAEFQALLGIFRRKCDYEKGTYRYYVLGGIPWGRTRHFRAGARERGHGESPRRRRRRPRRRKVSLENREPGG